MSVDKIKKQEPVNPNIQRLAQIKDVAQSVCNPNIPLAKAYEARKMIWGLSNRFDQNCSYSYWCPANLVDEKRKGIDKALTCVVDAEKRNKVSLLKRWWRRNIGQFSKASNVSENKEEKMLAEKLINPNIERLVQIKALRTEVCKPNASLKTAYELRRKFYGTLQMYSFNDCEPKWQSKEYDRQLNIDSREFERCIKALEQQNKISNFMSWWKQPSSLRYLYPVPYMTYEQEGQRCPQDSADIPPPF